MAISASPQAQAKLLVIQGLDTKLIQLAHKRAGIPEVEAARELEITLGSIDLKIVAVDTEISDLELIVRKAEADVDQVRQRAENDKARMDSGTLGAKDLEALSHELESLARRQSELEETELEVMQTLEDATAAKAGLVEQRVEIEAELDAVKTSAASQLAEIDAQVAVIESDRQAEVEESPQELIALYDKIRNDFGGFGAAEFKNGECQGCHITLDTNELEHIKKAAADEVIRCQECRVILVRS